MIKNVLAATILLVGAPVECLAWGRAEIDADCAAKNAHYSTSSQMCECNSGFTESGGTCVSSSGGGSYAPSRDYAAERRAQEAAAESQRLYEQRKREDEERRVQEENERQAEFIRRRDETAPTLRGSGGGLRITANSSGAGELRGSRIDTGIRDIKQAASARDLGGKNAAWKQLNCSAALAGFAFAALSKSGQPDYEEFRDMAGEAMSALNGGRLGVECPKAPAAPAAYGSGAGERIAAKYKVLLEQGIKLGEDLGKVRAKRKEALDRLIEIKKAIADPKEKSELDQLRDARAKLDRQQDDKYAPMREAQARINAANAREAEKLKAGAREAAEAARRAANGAYESVTKHEAEDVRKLKEVKEAMDGIAANHAEAIRRLEDLKLGGGL